MITEEVIELARRLSRVTTLSASQEDCVRLLNVGLEDFAHQVGGIDKRAVLIGRTSFVLPAGAYLRVNNTNLLITEADIEDASGQEIEEMFNELNAPDYELGYNAQSFQFTLTAPGQPSLFLEPDSPLCVNQYLLGSRFVDIDENTFTNRPQETKFFVEIEDGYVDVHEVKFNGQELTSKNIDIDRAGTPLFYTARNNRIYLSPHPLSQGPVGVKYTGFPSSINVTYFVDELSGEVTDLIDVISPIPLPKNTHKTLAYFLASKLAEEQHEYPIADRMLALYNRDIGRYIVEKANANPDIGFGEIY
jgi:hypothetical protein